MPVKILVTKLATRVEEIRARVMGLCYHKQSIVAAANSSSTTASSSGSAASAQSSSDNSSISGNSSDSAEKVLTIQEKAEKLRTDIFESIGFIEKIAGDENPILNRKTGLLNEFRKEKHDKMNIFQKFSANAFTEERESTSRLIKGFSDCESQLWHAISKLRGVAQF